MILTLHSLLRIDTDKWRATRVPLQNRLNCVVPLFLERPADDSLQTKLDFSTRQSQALSLKFSCAEVTLKDFLNAVVKPKTLLLAPRIRSSFSAILYTNNRLKFTSDRVSMRLVLNEKQTKTW
jgi:hypothetical protein